MVLLVAAGWWVAVALPVPSAVGDTGVAAGRRGAALAEAFVRHSATFRFDGIADSLRLESMRALAACPGCYEYTFFFQSQHPGYGDRSGQRLAAGVTAHRATIVLNGATVVSGVLDGAWDMLSQRILDFE